MNCATVCDSMVCSNYNGVGVINGSVVSQYNMDANFSILDIIFSHAVVKPRVGLNRHNTHPTLYSAFL